MRPFLTLLLSTLLCTGVPAQELQLFESFTDHAVLQRNVDHPLWGWAEPGKVVRVVFGDQRLSVKADKGGRWRVSLPATPAGGPHLISVMSGKEAVLLRDVYFGDVYLLGGQSNMYWSLERIDPSGKLAADLVDPLVRELRVKLEYDAQPREHLPLDEGADRWVVGTAEGHQKFSAVGAYFANNIRREIGIPIGLLHSSWGGSRIEPWMRPQALGLDGEAQNPQDVLNPAGKTSRARFATDFPGRELPTEDLSDNAAWLADDVDVSAWPTMKLPTLWEDAGYPGVDGVFYFRRTFDLTAEQAAGKATLHLGPIDDDDFTYLNGQLVGTTSDHAAARDYEIGSGLLRVGENTLAIRVVDKKGGGGFTSGAAEKMKLSTVAGDVPLAGGYRFHIGAFRVGGDYNKVPVILYNAMIAPLKGYPLTAVLWYQGESNAGEGDNVKYSDLKKGLINDWRDVFNNPELPFYWVQLAGFKAPPTSANDPGWATLRQSQTDALELPHTGQAVITDIGEADNIHPRNKWEVGRRLSLHALRNIYEQKVQAASPVAISAQDKQFAIEIKFEELGGGLMIKNQPANDPRYNRLIEGFTVQAADGEWHFAFGILSPDSQEVAVLTPDGIGQPKKIRYAWASNPDRANLFSKDGLPVTPFELVVE